MKNHRILVKINASLGTLNAGEYGYHEASFTIPSGYKTTGIVSIGLGHPGAAGGLCATAGVSRGLSGTKSIFISYYTPKSIAENSSDLEIAVECISNAYFTDQISG